MMLGISSIKTKIVLAMMLATGVGMAVILAVFIGSQVTLLEQKLAVRINAHLDFLSLNIGPAILFDDQLAASEMLSTLAVDETVLEAKLFRGTDLLLAHYRLNDEPFPADSLMFSKAVTLDDEILGDLQVLVTQSPLNRQIDRLFKFSLLTYVMVSLVIYLMSLWVQRLISEPIVKLNRVVEEVTKTRRYKTRVVQTSNDEIGQLGQQFNRMLSRIEERDKMLEKKVASRTAELQRMAEEFRHRAFHDSLTGVYNRAYLADYFEKAVAHAQRFDNHFAVLLLDVDNFKTINDTLGHDVGDELLQYVVRQLRKSLRRDDLIVRIGGDEFVMLLENIEHINHVPCLADLIVDTVRQETFVGEQRIEVTVSIGGSVYPQHGSDMTSLKRTADIAMYKAKVQGRNQFCLYNRDMVDLSDQRLVVQNNMRTAIDEHQLKVYYQPKVDALTQRVVGCEALVRWIHSDYGMLAPDSFIPIAEKCGLIKELDRYVLHQACVQAKRWQEERGLGIPIAVNLSALHFTSNAIVKTLEHELKLADLDCGLLEIEVTEAVLIDDPAAALEALSGIRQLGVKISLDDFGTGYSSLNYLRSLPVSLVKIDRSFVTNMLTDDRDNRLTCGIIALIQGMELNVLAEGVETLEQEAHLLKLGCSQLQGYAYAKPCPADEFLEWVLHNGRFRVMSDSDYSI